MRVQLTVRRGTVEREVVVECDPATTAAELAPMLCAEHDHDHDDCTCRLSVVGRTVSPHALVGMPPLLAGAVVTLAEVHAARPGATGPAPWLLCVDSGPDVGLVLALGRRPAVVGRAAGADLRLTDAEVSRRHVEVVAQTDAVTVRDLGGTNGTWVGGRRLGDLPKLLGPGDTIRVGGTTLSLEPSPREPRQLRGDGQGHLLLDPPAGAPTTPPAEVRFPDPPPDHERSRFPLMALLVPVALAGVLAAVMRSPTMLLFGLGGPVLSAASWASTRTGRRRSRRAEVVEARRAGTAAEAELTAAMAAERRALQRAHPPPAALLVAAESRSDQVWVRGGMPSTPAPLNVRLGLGSRPIRTVVTGGTARAAPSLADMPVTLDLEQYRTLRVRGERAAVLAAVTNLVTRLGVQHAPSRVVFDILVDASVRCSDWSFARLIPHVRSVTVPPVPPVDAHDDLDRREDRHEPSTPFLVVVLDGWPALRQLPDVARLLDAGGPHRCLVLLGEERRDGAGPGPPPLGTAVLTLVGAGAHLDLPDEPTVAVRPDRPGPAYAWRLARALAPLREARTALATGVPDRVRLLDGHPAATAPNGGTVDAEALRARWAVRPRSTRFRLGVGGAGPLEVDLAVDGPHTLVAGTTGSGKSELLQTLVCSLALENRPDEMTFVLVDYKGGAAFRGCAALPHVVGWVTDLDPHLTRRALVSLVAEVRRRERLLAGAGAADLGEYHRRRDASLAAGVPHPAARLPALARLVIVVDEFRVLVEELPDFVPGLVRLAAVGRSLGIHLVLATQRPGGVVTADMRANLSLRIALRVRDRTDSLDVIESPVAAAITPATPGRALLRGASTSLTELQTAQVTGRPEARAAVRVTDVTRWWGLDPGRDPMSSNTGAVPTATDVGERGPRDLETIVDAATRAADALGIASTPAPWLPPLPDVVDVADLSGHPTPSGSVRSLALGLEDLPSEQRQEPWGWPLDGHLGIAGGPASGRTTALRTIAGALADTLPPEACHLYAIGPGALAFLADLPHTAAVAATRDSEHVALVVDRLAAAVRERAASRPAAPPPLLVVLVDGWEQLSAVDGGEAAAALRGLLDPARRVGVLAVVTGGRAVLSGPLASALTHRLALRLPDPVELALAGVPARAAPQHQPPGRAVDLATHREVQLGVLGGSPEVAVQDARLAAVAQRRRSDPGRPTPVCVLPPRVWAADCLAPTSPSPRRGG
ncbi:MAG: FtsK/SpoIIIE domain-containing protein, partial [Lapillicoccus sp.]